MSSPLHIIWYSASKKKKRSHNLHTANKKANSETQHAQQKEYFTRSNEKNAKVALPPKNYLV